MPAKRPRYNLTLDADLLDRYENAGPERQA